MLPRKSSTRPIRQPAARSWSAATLAAPSPADWLRTSTLGVRSVSVVAAVVAGALVVAAGPEVAPDPADVAVGVAAGVARPEDWVPLPSGLAVTSSSSPAPVAATIAVMTAAMAMTASSWVRKSLASWP